MDQRIRPWPALWSLIIGFFMILVDTTIVSVANPAIMEGLHTDIDAVIWVTSAYLLAYAVPLLVAGRLGDRFGPKSVYITGLVIFTIASAWCGFSGSIAMLIAARVLQGVGAALMTPQTMTVVTRLFPPDQRGAAMGLWGAVAGVATLVGPVLGGVLVDSLGWEWIFFLNVPLGIIGLVLAVIFVPRLETKSHRFDIVGVILSAVGMFLLVFGIQEGETYNWGTIVGPITVWSLIIAGVAILALFVVWQRIQKGEPLVPLQLFRDRNFSLANVATTMVGIAITCFALPLVFYFQIVRGMTPTQSALMLVPMAVVSGVLAPLVGRALNRRDPRPFALVGLLLLAAGLVWYAAILQPTTPIWLLLLPSVVLGLANAAIWAPISNAAVRNLKPQLAGAGSGVFNATRQLGAVLGSAAIAVLIQTRLSAELPGLGEFTGSEASAGGALPADLQSGFAAAMGQSLLLPAVVAVVGAVAVTFFARPQKVSGWENPTVGDAQAAAPGEAPAVGASPSSH